MALSSSKVHTAIHNLVPFLDFASWLAIPSARSLMRILNRTRVIHALSWVHNMSSLLVSKQHFWLVLRSVQVKMCSIFLKILFFLLTSQRALCPYLKPVWIISTLPTWTIRLPEWKIDCLVFDVCSRQIHIGCSLAPHYTYRCFDVESLFIFQDLSGY